MRSVIDTCGVELRRRLRDRSALVMAFIAPVALAVIIATAFGGTDEALHAEVVVADLDGGQLATAYREQLLANAADAGLLTIRDVADADSVDRAVASGGADVGVVLPAGLDDAVVGMGDGGGAITIVRSPEGALAGDFVVSLTEQFTIEAERRAGSAMAGRAAGPPLLALVDGDTDGDGDADGDPDAGAGGIDAASYFGPSMALFFAFFVLGAAPRNLLADRAAGRLARVQAAPVPAWSSGAGVTLAAIVIAGASVAVVWLVTSLGFGASWGDPLAVVLLVAVTVLAIGALTALVAGVAATPQQASNYVSVAAFTLGLLGGHFFALHQLPPALQWLASATPNGQALRAFTDLTADGATVADIWPALAGIGAFALLVGVLATAVLGRRLDR